MGSPMPRKATEQEALLALEQGMGQIAAQFGQVKTTLELARASRIISETTYRQYYERVVKLYDETALLVTSVAEAESRQAANAPVIFHPNHRER